MRSVLTALFIILIMSGCATKYPTTAHLNPTIAVNDFQFSPPVSATLRSEDKRKQEHVIRFLLPQHPETVIDSFENPNTLITQELVEALKKQGVQFTESSTNRILVYIHRLNADVEKPKLLYLTEASAMLEVQIHKDGNSIGKTFSRTIHRQSALQPKVDELEGVLDTLLSEILTQIVQDKNFRTFLNKPKTPSSSKVYI